MQTGWRAVRDSQVSVTDKETECPTMPQWPAHSCQRSRVSLGRKLSWAEGCSRVVRGVGGAALGGPGLQQGRLTCYLDEKAVAYVAELHGVRVRLPDVLLHLQDGPAVQGEVPLLLQGHSGSHKLRPLSRQTLPCSVPSPLPSHCPRPREVQWPGRPSQLVCMLAPQRASSRGRGQRRERKWRSREDRTLGPKLKSSRPQRRVTAPHHPASLSSKGLGHRASPPIQVGTHQFNCYVLLPARAAHVW